MIEITIQFVLHKKVLSDVKSIQKKNTLWDLNPGHFIPYLITGISALIEFKCFLVVFCSTSSNPFALTEISPFGIDLLVVFRHCPLTCEAAVRFEPKVAVGREACFRVLAN